MSNGLSWGARVNLVFEVGLEGSCFIQYAAPAVPHLARNLL